jgi:hypothetical protein
VVEAILADRGGLARLHCLEELIGAARDLPHCNLAL